MVLLAALILPLLMETASVRANAWEVSLLIPDGWRRMDAADQQRHRPALEPQNKWQHRLEEEPSTARSLLAMKHDSDADATIAANAQFVVSRLPAQLHLASSIEAAHVIAFGALATFRGTWEVEPREITVSGFPAAEWVQRYKIVDKSGAAHAMRARSIAITMGDDLYMFGYAGPAADTADFEAFDRVVKSIHFQKRGS